MLLGDRGRRSSLRRNRLGPRIRDCGLRWQDRLLLRQRKLRLGRNQLPRNRNQLLRSGNRLLRNRNRLRRRLVSLGNRRRRRCRPGIRRLRWFAGNHNELDRSDVAVRRQSMMHRQQADYRRGVQRERQPETPPRRFTRDPRPGRFFAHRLAHTTSPEEAAILPTQNGRGNPLCQWAEFDGRLRGQSRQQARPLGKKRGQKKRRAKKTAVLLAPPKFREETSKKAVRRSASATRIMAFAAAACKRNLLHCSIARDHVLARVADWPRTLAGTGLARMPLGLLGPRCTNGADLPRLPAIDHPPTTFGDQAVTQRPLRLEALSDPEPFDAQRFI